MRTFGTWNSLCPSTDLLVLLLTKRTRRCTQTAEDAPNRMPWKSRRALIQNDYLNHAVYEDVVGSGVRGEVQRKSKNWHIEGVHAS